MISMLSACVSGGTTFGNDLFFINGENPSKIFHNSEKVFFGSLYQRYGTVAVNKIGKLVFSVIVNKPQTPAEGKSR